MIRVNLQEIAPTGGYNEIVRMPAVPRVGDSVQPTEELGCFEVRSVIWTPNQLDYDVQVRFR